MEKLKLEDLTDAFIDKCYRETGSVPGPAFSESYRNDVCPLEAVGRFLGCQWSEVLKNQEDTHSFYHGFDGNLHYYPDSPGHSRGIELRKRLLCK